MAKSVHLLFLSPPTQKLFTITNVKVPRHRRHHALSYEGILSIFGWRTPPSWKLGIGDDTSTLGLYEGICGRFRLFRGWFISYEGFRFIRISTTSFGSVRSTWKVRLFGFFLLFELIFVLAHFRYQMNCFKKDGFPQCPQLLFAKLYENALYLRFYHLKYKNHQVRIQPSTFFHLDQKQFQSLRYVDCFPD